MRVHRSRTLRGSHLCTAIAWVYVCACLAVFVSTVCYVVEVRSCCRPLRRDYDAIVETTHRLARFRNLLDVPQQRLLFRGVWARTVFDARRVSGTVARPRAQAAASLYSVQQIECSWLPSASPVQSFSAAANVSPLLFFIHGSAGGYSQGNYWSCAAQYIGKAFQAPVETFSFDFAKQANVHRGLLVATQAEYVADVVEATVHEKGSAARGDLRLPVWLVAHSMGGCVARMAAQLLSSTVTLAGIITFNAPLRFPPLLLDAPMADVYRAVTEAEQQPAEGCPDSPPSATFTRVTSSELLYSCTVGNCSVRRSCRQERVRLISVTSGAMDLQIEPSTTHPSVWRSAYAVSTFNTLHPSFCGRSNSHDDVLLSPCTMVLAALLLVSSSIGGDNTERIMRLIRDTADAHERDALSAASFSPALSLAASVGQALWKLHVWPCAVAALYSHVLLSGLHPHLRRVAQAVPLRERAMFSARHFVAEALSKPFMSATITFGFFYTCALAHATSTTVSLWLFGGWESQVARAPWNWAWLPQWRVTSASVAAPTSLMFLRVAFMFASMGPVALGTVVGMAVVRAAQTTHQLTRVLNCGCPKPASRRARRLRSAVVTLLLFCLACALVAFGVTLATRALVWLTLLLLAPRAHRLPGKACVQEGEAVTVLAGTVTANAEAASLESMANAQEEEANKYLPSALYGAVYTLQLSPFFSIRNAIISKTFEDASTLDWRNYAAELGALWLLVVAASTPFPFHCRRVPLPLRVSVACLSVALVGVGVMVSHPFESFRALPALLCCLPAYVLSTMRT
ncbi:hypothetical protein LSCM1_06342 [Leishmania martiniquensis]|uniref:GPI inositol-deacylase n=1 Tax=Leishmania martiniquensis TaxID=1580590 RepID=A0A836KWH8_9TRYP|nr:hypothetical protein LSCM1_06342 [Leishmania martiniquensis]